MNEQYVSNKFLMGLILEVAAAAFAIIGLIPVALVVGVIGFFVCFPEMLDKLIAKIMNPKK